LKKEIEMLDKVVKNPEHPVVAIMGGAKVSTKINFISRLMEIADHLLIGGGLANTFFAAEGYEMGSSFYEKDEKQHAETLIQLSHEKKTELVIPVDIVIGDKNNPDGNDVVVKPNELPQGETRGILDVGPQTQAIWGNFISQAKTIIWNGPVGYMEHRAFRRGTDFLYYAITQNTQATSVVGGGETLTAISKKEYLDKITHISTGGGAMLEYIEKGTLPGIEALKQNA
jgi:phosphoglycerate kinase